MADKLERAGITRADFCKSVALGLAALGLGGFGLEALADGPTDAPLDRPDADFTLRALPQLLETYELPTTDFDPAGDWEHTYSLFVWAPALLWKHNAELTLTRQRAASGHKLNALCRRPGLSGYSHFLKLEADCATNALGTPRSWTATTKCATGADAPAWLYSEGHVTGRAEGRTLFINHGGGAKKTPLSQPFTLSWGLFEAVQRLPGERTRALDFTVVDECDALQPDQRLGCFNQLRLQLARGPETLTGYAQQGPGTSYPTLYWVDEAGRLLLVWSGLDVWVLSAENGAPIAYEWQGIKAADFKQQPRGGGPW